jgi:hypothetical protein
MIRNLYRSTKSSISWPIFRILKLQRTCAGLALVFSISGTAAAHYPPVPEKVLLGFRELTEPWRELFGPLALAFCFYAPARPVVAGKLQRCAPSVPLS